MANQRNTEVPELHPTTVLSPEFDILRNNRCQMKGCMTIIVDQTFCRMHLNQCAKLKKRKHYGTFLQELTFLMTLKLSILFIFIVFIENFVFIASSNLI